MQTKAKCMYLQVKPHRRVKTTRLVWKPLNSVQRWLEGPDKPSAKVVAYGVLVVTGLYMLGQVVRWML